MNTVLANDSITKARGGAPNTSTSAPSLQQLNLAPSERETQYDKKTADFFKTFNEYTGRPHLFYGYMAGVLEECASSNSRKRVAIDFGCGTGWLTRQLASLDFTRVHGVDTSKHMRRLAFSETPNNYIQDSIVTYGDKIPESVEGKCSLVTAVHVHYHFTPIDSLRKNFFGAIASALEPEGRAIIVGCPSDHVRTTPDHYQNCVHVSDVPQKVLDGASDPEMLQDDDGYIGLSCLPKYDLEDGTQMKVTFNALDRVGKPHTATVMDTFWKDSTLIKTAQECDLQLDIQRNLAFNGHRDAYMMMVFKKVNRPPAIITPQTGHLSTSP